MSAALLRVAAPFASQWQYGLLNVSGAAWTLAFLIFVASYGPILCTARKTKAH